MAFIYMIHISYPRENDAKTKKRRILQYTKNKFHLQSEIKFEIV